MTALRRMKLYLSERFFSLLHLLCWFKNKANSFWCLRLYNCMFPVFSSIIILSSHLPHSVHHADAGIRIVQREENGKEIMWVVRAARDEQLHTQRCDKLIKNKEENWDTGLKINSRPRALKITDETAERRWAQVWEGRETKGEIKKQYKEKYQEMLILFHQIK